MAELFEKGRTTITEHLKNIFSINTVSGCKMEIEE